MEKNNLILPDRCKKISKEEMIKCNGGFGIESVPNGFKLYINHLEVLGLNAVFDLKGDMSDLLMNSDMLKVLREPSVIEMIKKQDDGKGVMFTITKDLKIKGIRPIQSKDDVKKSFKFGFVN